MGDAGIIGRPEPSEYPEHYAKYVELVTEADLLTALGEQVMRMRDVAQAVPGDKETFAYAPGKWNVREVFGHLIDVERVFGYRAFGMSRGDAGPFPGFDDEMYVARSGASARPLAELATEFAMVRFANLAALKPLDAAAWRLAGVANGKQATVRAIAFMMVGHPRHHLDLLRSRYGLA
jgi:hypothetical protein